MSNGTNNKDHLVTTL